MVTPTTECQTSKSVKSQKSNRTDDDKYLLMRPPVFVELKVKNFGSGGILRNSISQL